MRTAHVQALSVMLGTALIMSAEKFVKEVASELRLFNTSKDLQAIKHT